MTLLALFVSLSLRASAAPSPEALKQDSGARFDLSASLGGPAGAVRGRSGRATAVAALMQTAGLKNAEPPPPGPEIPKGGDVLRMLAALGVAAALGAVPYSMGGALWAASSVASGIPVLLGCAAALFAAGFLAGMIAPRAWPLSAAAAWAPVRLGLMILHKTAALGGALAAVSVGIALAGGWAGSRWRGRK